MAFYQAAETDGPLRLGPGVGAPGLESAIGRCTRGERGFTLVELLIALLLSSVLFSSMIVVFQSQIRINTVEADVVEIQQNARVAMNALATDIRQAGYFVDQFNRQPIWLDAGPYQLIFNANLSETFVSMHRDSAVPLSDGTMYQPGMFTDPPHEENLPAFLDRYLNESETIRFTLDRTYDGFITAADRQTGTPNQNVYMLQKEINGNPPAVLSYNVRGPVPYPDGTIPQPLFQYWGTFDTPDSLSLWGDANGNGRLDPGEIAALTPVPLAMLPQIRQVDVSITVESNRPDRRYEGPGSTSTQPNRYRSYNLRGRIRARNVGINPLGLILCGLPPTSPRDPIGYDTPYDQGGSITLEWKSSTDEFSGETDVTYYSIYRRIEGGDFQVVGQVQAVGIDTVYVFEDDGEIDNFNAPIDGQGYYYYISAWDCAPQESNPSPVVGPIVSLPNGPGPPMITDAWDTPCEGGESITVQFTRSAQDDASGTGVSHYHIYRGTAPDSTVVSKVLVDSLVADGSAMYHYLDTAANWAGLPPANGVDYWYIVHAVQGGVASENSNEWGAVQSSSGLSAPYLVSVEDKPADDGTALILTWRRSMSETCSPAPTAYRVYRRVKGTVTWNVIQDLPVAFQVTYEWEDDNNGSGLLNGTTYEYHVEVRTTGAAQKSNVREGTPLDNPPVGPPVGLVVVDVPCNSEGDLQISWNRSPDDGAGAYTADEYRLYRRLDGGTTWQHMTTISATGAPTYSWVDNETNNPGTSPVIGNVYWYRATAYDLDSSSESNPSNQDSALSDGSPGAPTITAAYDMYSSGSRAIKVEFSASEDDGGCANSVTRYHIYRTTTSGSYSSTYIGTLNANASASYVWVDDVANSAAPPLDTFSYYYVVRAYDAVNMIESQNSNEFGPVDPFGTNCECCPIFFDDMESGNVGWTSGASPSYRNDWELGTPNGKSFDPSLAYSGANIWGTDLGHGARDGQYSPSMESWLISPTLDLSGFTEGYIYLYYQRWLSVEKSTADKAQIRVNNGDGWTVVWQNGQSDNHVDSGWMLHGLDLTQWALGRPSVRIAFTLQTNASQQFGGWNIDDVLVCYTAPGPCDYFFYVGDSVAQNQGNNLFFEITNGADVTVDMLGMKIGWSAEGSLLRSIQDQTGGATLWTAIPSEPQPLEAIFNNPVTFAPGETRRFRLQYLPGQMRGSALILQFITACGISNEVVIMVPS